MPNARILWGKHKVWTEMHTTWKYSVCVPYVDNFQMEMDTDFKKNY